MWSYHLVAYCPWHLTSLQSSRPLASLEKGTEKRQRKEGAPSLHKGLWEVGLGKRERTGCTGGKRKDLEDRRHKSAGKRSCLAAWGTICGKQASPDIRQGLRRINSPRYVWTEQFACRGCSYNRAAEPQETGVHCSPPPGAILRSHFPPQPPLSRARLLDSVFPSRQWRQPHFLRRAAVKMN